MAPEDVERLTMEQVADVLALVSAATEADAVAPLSEQVLLAARDGETGASAASTLDSSHLLSYDGTQLAGYAHLERGEDGESPTAELVVDPSYRRRGVGTALLRALEVAVSPEAETIQLWSHGDLDGARALARREDFRVVRELWQMRRPLGSDAASDATALPSVSLPDGFTIRRFVVGQDEDAWLSVNARAFVDHPEQGRINRFDLDRRVAEPWFDAEGFILIEDVRGPEPVLAASHWTKVVPVDTLASPTEGEVYVVAVDPAYQGQGLGRAVTVLGLEHLSQLGLAEATLYVEADNPAAIATYSRLGFVRSAVDIMYSRIVHLPV